MWVWNDSDDVFCFAAWKQKMPWLSLEDWRETLMDSKTNGTHVAHTYARTHTHTRTHTRTYKCVSINHRNQIDLFNVGNLPLKHLLSKEVLLSKRDNHSVVNRVFSHGVKWWQRSFKQKTLGSPSRVITPKFYCPCIVYGWVMAHINESWHMWY